MVTAPAAGSERHFLTSVEFALAGLHFNVRLVTLTKTTQSAFLM